MYDVVIVGGSFAGLATAMQLRDYKVLVVDQYPIGTHQMSACGTPLATAQAVGAAASVLEVHDTIVMHSGGRSVRFPLRVPYVTFDYEEFCRAMLDQTSAEVWTARAISVEDGRVETSAGTATARFVIDATGWRSHKKAGDRPEDRSGVVGYGVETELDAAVDVEPGLHFFWEKEIVRSGYAWVFPCGGSVRFGVCSFEKGVRLGPELACFVARWGLQVGTTHGGVLAIQRRAAMRDGVFVVGDATGRCLPVTGEGIRTAIVDGIACGRTIGSALDGSLGAAEARARHSKHVRQTERFHSYLLKMQKAVAYTPDRLIGLAGQLCSPRPVIDRVIQSYLTHSGWVAS